MDLRKGVIVSRTNLVDTKKESGVPWKGLGVILFLTLAVWAGAFLYNDLSKKNISSLQQNLNTLKSGRDYPTIAVVADSESRLLSSDVIFTERVDWEQFFKKIEEDTIPEVTFTSLETTIIDKSRLNVLSSPGGEGNLKYQAIFKGTTLGLNNVAKQMAVFEDSLGKESKPMLLNLKIEKIDMKKSGEGEVEQGNSLDFIIRADINPEVIKNDYNKSNL